MKFKVGDKVRWFSKEETSYVNCQNQIGTILTLDNGKSIHIITLKMNDEVKGLGPSQTFFVSENEIKLVNSDIIRERLGIK